MRVIFVRTKETETVSKHNSHGASYYRILARTVGGGPVIVARGESYRNKIGAEQSSWADGVLV